MAQSTILPYPVDKDQINTTLQTAFLYSMIHAARTSISLSYRNLAYLEEQAKLLLTVNPEATPPRNVLNTAKAELEATRLFLEGVIQLFQVDVDGGE